MRPDQAETDKRQLAKAEQRAALEAQAAALSAKMAESHLAVFRAEAKNRRVSGFFLGFTGGLCRTCPALPCPAVAILEAFMLMPPEGFKGVKIVEILQGLAKETCPVEPALRSVQGRTARTPVAH